MGNAIIKVNPIGGTQAVFAGGLVGPISTSGVQINATNIVPMFLKIVPPQIAGLIPLYDCNSSDCRDSQQLACYINPVFGQTGANGPSYSNDFNTWLVDTANSFSAVQFAIFKATNGWFPTRGPFNWNQVASITNNTYGVNYAVGKIPNHPTYQGFAVNWGAVLNAFGPGIYRIGVNNVNVTYSQASTYIPANQFPTNFLGTVNIGSWSTTAWWTGTLAQNMAYLVALINSSSQYTASYTGGNLNIYGTNGASSNNVKVTISGKWLSDGNPYKVIKILTGGGTASTTYTCLSNTPPFLLRAWDCNIANGTVKFETWLPNVIGSVTTPGQIFDLCGISWYDSVRLKAFFGNKKFTYNELMYEYGQDNVHAFGLMEGVRDKAIPGYKFNSHPIPQWLQDRLAIYGFMAQTILVSDYNLSNSDWNIVQRNVIKKSGVEPTYLNDKPFSANQRYKQRASYMSMDFEEGIQSIIKNYCCLNS